MTKSIDNTDVTSVTAAVTLRPEQQLIGRDINVSGTISNNGTALPRAKALLTLDGPATFYDGSQKKDVQSDDTGQIAPVPIKCGTQGGGSVTLAPVEPDGLSDQKQYDFVTQDASPKVTLSLNPNTAWADGIHKITANATLTNNDVPMAGYMTFDLIGAAGASFEGPPPGQRQQVVQVGPGGDASVNIVDSTAEAGTVKATGSGAFDGTPSAASPFTFTTPPDVTISLSPRTVNFEAATSGAPIYIEVYANGEPLAGQAVMLEIGDSANPAFFNPGQTKSITVTTGPEGKATAIINAFTWCSGTVSAKVDYNGSSSFDSVDYNSTVPVGLKVDITDVEYCKINDQNTWYPPKMEEVKVKDGNGSDATIEAYGVPATKNSYVKVHVQYKLNDSPWAGYGQIVFSVDSNALLSENISSPKWQNTVSAMYNTPDENYISSGEKWAEVFMQDGVIELVKLTYQGDPAVIAVTTDTQKTTNVNFGAAWAVATNGQVQFIGSGAAYAKIYQNGVHQAAVLITFTLADFANKDLTEANMPSIEDVKSAIKLIDFKSSEAYSVLNSSTHFSSVQYGFTSNNFAKEIQSGGSMVVPSMVTSGADGSQFDGPKVKLYYYITFDNDGVSGLLSTMVGMNVQPTSPYAGVSRYSFSAKGGSSSAQTVQINGLFPLTYGNDGDVVQVVTASVNPSTQNAGSVNKNGPDPIENYQRRWDATVTLNDQYGSKLFGAFISDANVDTNNNTPVSTEDCVFFDVKRGMYQIKAYLWQTNLYLISEDDYQGDVMDPSSKVTAPDKTQTMTLDGVTLAGDSMTNLKVSDYAIGITVVAGFGDLGPSANTWRNTKLKLVDIYGNATAEYSLNLNLPSPGALMSTMNNTNGNGWKPLTLARIGGGPSSIPGQGVEISRLVTSDDQNKDYGNQEKNLYWGNAGKDMVTQAGGRPVSAVLSSNLWTLTLANSQQLNNQKLYKMSALYNGAEYYIMTFGSNVSDKGYHPVVGVVDVNSSECVQLKPYWNDGTVMIFAAKDSNTQTDGTYWRWSGVTDGMQNDSVMVFGYKYGDATAMALWVFDVGGQAQMDIPQPPQNQ